MSSGKYDKRHPIAIAIYAAGGINEVAAKMGVSTQYLVRCRAEKRIPTDRAAEFCRITGANLTEVLTQTELENIRLLATLLFGDDISNSATRYTPKGRKVNRKLL